jgi:hypothetical protein
MVLEMPSRPQEPLPRVVITKLVHNNSATYAALAFVTGNKCRILFANICEMSSDEAAVFPVDAHMH